MTDTVKPISKDFRTGISIAVIVWCAIGVSYLIYAGSDTNSLHESAMSWFFLTIILVLAALGLVSVTPQIIEASRK